MSPVAQFVAAVQALNGAIDARVRAMVGPTAPAETYGAALLAAIRAYSAANAASCHPDVGALYLGVTGVWAATGFQRVVTSHKHAALLMCTRVPGEVVAAVAPPWPAFVLDVPAGVLPPFDGRRDVCAFLLVADVAHQLVVFFGGQTGLCYDQPLDLRLALADEEHADPHVVMLLRFALGVLLELDGHRPAPGAPARPGGACKRDARGAVVTTTHVLRRDVRIDCRDAVRAACSGAAKPRGGVAVRTLVRGHWKMQPHGPGRSARRFARVDAYWRGPADAPIALRSHVLDAAGADPQKDATDAAG